MFIPSKLKAKDKLIALVDHKYEYGDMVYTIKKGEIYIIDENNDIPMKRNNPYNYKWDKNSWQLQDKFELLEKASAYPKWF